MGWFSADFLTVVSCSTISQALLIREARLFLVVVKFYRYSKFIETKPTYFEYRVIGSKCLQ